MSELLLLLFFILVCISYYVIIKRRRSKARPISTEEETEQTQAKQNDAKKRAEGCCGAHAVCEKESLLSTKPTAEYYEDEELDVFKGRTSDSYNEEETAQFSEVLYTLKETEVAGWLRSLQIRGISLPDVLRDEALLIVGERRFNQSSTDKQI